MKHYRTIAMKFRRSYGLVGVDLGARAIKLAQLERTPAGLRLVNARVIVRESGDEDDGADTIAWWEETLSNERLDTQFIGRAAACIASAPSADVQLLTIPDGSAKEQRAMLEGELASQAGGGMERYAFDFWTIPGNGATSAEENVAAATLSIDDGERIAKALQSSGLICQQIEPKALAMARAQRLLGTPAEQPVAVLDWGYEQACLLIIHQGRPLFLRNLRDCGFRRVLSSLAHALEMTDADSQTLLTAVGLAGPDAAEAELPPVRDAIENVAVQPLQSLLVELHKTLNYIGEHRPRLRPVELRLCGGGATIRNITFRLEERLGRAVRAWRCDSVHDFGLLAGRTPLFAGALAVSGLKWSAHEDL
jgi:Tfp pilus assembly PilM family ATPase